MPKKKGALELLKAKIENLLSDSFSTWSPQAIRDNKVVRDAIFGFTLLYKHEINLLDCPIVQRLRDIRQTALASLTYPSATHTRFEHSLGCLHLASRMISSVREKKKTSVGAKDVAEVRLAALLHDVGHGPFSHASEYCFAAFPVFEQIIAEHNELFRDAQAHEVLSYLIITSKAFKAKFKEVIDLYKDDRNVPFPLADIDLDRVGLYILGRWETPSKRFLSQIINGPFDVDKLDYLHRDGYFTGLQTSVDLERLFLTLDTGKEEKIGSTVLCTDLSGVTVLEQILFNRMLLFSSVYHHHKIRAALYSLVAVFEYLQDIKPRILAGVGFTNPIDFLRVTDGDILNSLHRDRRLKQLVEGIRSRHLPIRVAVICTKSMEMASAGIPSTLEEIHLLADVFRAEICRRSGIESCNVFVDLPSFARIYKVGIEAYVKDVDGKLIPLGKIHPIDRWVIGYAQYRYKGYVLCQPEVEKQVRKHTMAIFAEQGYKLNENAFKMAKRSIHTSC